MSMDGGLHLLLLRPWWLLALVAAAALALLGRRGAALGAWRRAVDPALLAALIARGHLVAGRRGAAALRLTLACLLAVALAGPARDGGAAPTWRNLDALVVALDVSRSVAAGGNLAAARLATARAIEAAAPRAVALIAYAGDAYLASGFTTDPAALAGSLAALDGDTVPDAGSRPERALAMAGALLAQAHVIAGDVLLVSDGGGIGAQAYAQARAFGRDGQALHTLLVPPGAALPDGAPGPDRAGMVALAAQGGGVATDIGAFAPLLRRLGERPAEHLARSDFAVLAVRDGGPIVLALALLPAALLFRRRA